VQEFISEDDLKTFEGWLRYQGVDAATNAPEELQMWQGLFRRGTEAQSGQP
jgi:hypothetical protein